MKEKELDILERHALAADAAGMSYGKWMVAHGGQDSGRNAPEPDTVCPFCGRPFRKSRSNQKYCSRSCQSNASAIRSYYRKKEAEGHD